MHEVLPLEDRLNPTPVQGYFDLVTANGVDGTTFRAYGRARDLDVLSQNVQVHIYVGGSSPSNFAGTATANLFRQDLYNSGIGNRAIEFDLSSKSLTKYLDGVNHKVEIYGTDLNGENPVLLTRSPKYFQNTPVIGQVAAIRPNGLIEGHSYDPNGKTFSNSVHIYVDGFFATDAPANIYRSDVNAYYGITGNHGFSKAIPTSVYNTSSKTYFNPYDGKQHTASIYGIDLQAQGLAAAHTKLSSPFSTYTRGDGIIQSTRDVGGKGIIQVHTGGQFAGAIDSITWNGTEFIDKYDHGREAQTAMWGMPNSLYNNVKNSITKLGHINDHIQRYNPTEAGSQTDLQNIYSTSVLDNISTSANNQVSTNTTMAFWTPPTTDPLNPIEVLSGNNPNHWTAYNSDALSKNTMYKDAQIGAFGFTNDIKYTVSISIPEADQLRYIQFYPLVIYTSGALTQNLVYSYSNKTISTTSVDELIGSSSNSNLFVKASSDNTKAIALFSKQTSGPLAALPRRYDLNLGLYTNPTGGTSWSIMHTSYNINDTSNEYLITPHAATGKDSAYYGTSVTGNGVFTFDNYIVIGDRTLVQKTLSSLQTNGHI